MEDGRPKDNTPWNLQTVYCRGCDLIAKENKEIAESNQDGVLVFLTEAEDSGEQYFDSPS